MTETGTTQAVLPVAQGAPDLRVLGKVTGDIANATAGKLVVALRIVDSGKFARSTG
jgi:hypothetical protein